MAEKTHKLRMKIPAFPNKKLIPQAQKRLHCTLDLLLFFFSSLVAYFGFLVKQSIQVRKQGVSEII